MTTNLTFMVFISLQFFSITFNAYVCILSNNFISPSSDYHIDDIIQCSSSTCFFFFFFGSTLRLISVKTQNYFIHHCTGWVSFYDSGIIYLPPIRYESCFQLWGMTNNHIKPPWTRLLVYMYENLSRAVAFKLFWPWLILRNDVLHHDTHLCVYKTERKKKKFHEAKYPTTWDAFWYFSILWVRVFQIRIMIHWTDFTTH